MCQTLSEWRVLDDCDAFAGDNYLSLPFTSLEDAKVVHKMFRRTRLVNQSA
jgi:hypothetical protein